MKLNDQTTGGITQAEIGAEGGCKAESSPGNNHLINHKIEGNIQVSSSSSRVRKRLAWYKDYEVK